MELVGGFYTGTLTEQDIFTLVYTPILTPTGDTNQPPGGLMFGNYVFDLSAYVGSSIYLRFWYMTDWATYYGGWYIDNVYLDDVLVSDGTDASMFMDLSELFPTENDFSVTVVGMKVVKGVMTYQMLTGELPGAKLQPPSRKVQVDVRLDEIVLRALE